MTDLGLLITALLIHGVGKFYASRVVNKIDEAYQSEKSFISNASHEAEQSADRHSGRMRDHAS